MKCVYICNTVYHLMMAVVRLDESAENHLVLMDTILDVKQFADRSRKSGMFADVKSVKSTLFDVPSRYPDDFKEEWSAYFREFDRIGIFNDDTYISYFISQQNLKYVLFEDGFNFFQYPFDAHAHYRWWSEHKPEFGFMVPRGWSHTCERIEVNSFDNIPIDPRRKKMVEVPQKELFLNISANKRQALSGIFPEKIPRVSKRSTLILTQPLAFDGIMKSEKEQREYYEKICRDYSGVFRKVYLKPHPRDTIEYPRMRSVVQIHRTTPIEIFALLNPEFRFKRGVAHSSTALEFAYYVDEKIILEDLRNV